jgi:phage baseplate assembly protein W
MIPGCCDEKVCQIRLGSKSGAIIKHKAKIKLQKLKIPTNTTFGKRFLAEEGQKNQNEEMVAQQTHHHRHFVICR